MKTLSGATSIGTRCLNIGPVDSGVMAARAVRRLTDQINYHTRQNSAYRSGHGKTAQH